MQTPSTSEQIIQPSQSWIRFDFQELWNYRDLILLIIRRDFVTRYKQTILGPAWFVIQPILMTLVFTVVFGKVAQIPTDGLPPMLFYLCGLLGWNYFSQTVIMTSTTFTNNSYIFQKVYFPRLIMPLAVGVTNLFTFALQLITFFAFWIYFKLFTPAGAEFSLGPAVLLFPLLLLQTSFIALGVGLWMSALTAKYRDLSHLNNFIIQLWMYATPIIYPLSKIPEDKAWLVLLNPMAIIVESFKKIFLGTGTISSLYLITSIVTCVVVFITGLLAFQRTERTFADTV